MRPWSFNTFLPLYIVAAIIEDKVRCDLQLLLYWLIMPCAEILVGDMMTYTFNLLFGQNSAENETEGNH